MKNWKTILGIILVFVFGMLAGGLVTGKILQRRLRQGPPAVSETIVRRLSVSLHLDQQQRDELRTIVRDAQQEMETVRKQVQPQFADVFDRAEGRVREMLRSDQREQFEQIVDEGRAKWRPKVP